MEDNLPLIPEEKSVRFEDDESENTTEEKIETKEVKEVKEEFERGRGSERLARPKVCVYNL